MMPNRRVGLFAEDRYDRIKAKQYLPNFISVFAEDALFAWAWYPTSAL